ncbi:MAG: hypothetical protein WBG36_09765 [Ornithinimicrobium sp.]
MESSSLAPHTRNGGAVEWLRQRGLIEDDAAQQFATNHPDPGIP